MINERLLESIIRLYGVAIEKAFMLPMDDAETNYRVGIIAEQGLRGIEGFFLRDTKIIREMTAEKIYMLLQEQRGWMK